MDYKKHLSAAALFLLMLSCCGSLVPAYYTIQDTPEATIDIPTAIGSYLGGWVVYGLLGLTVSVGLLVIFSGVLWLVSQLINMEPVSKS